MHPRRHITQIMFLAKLDANLGFPLDGELNNNIHDAIAGYAWGKNEAKLKELSERFGGENISDDIEFGNQLREADNLANHHSSMFAKGKHDHDDNAEDLGRVMSAQGFYPEF